MVPRVQDSSHHICPWLNGLYRLPDGTSSRQLENSSTPHLITVTNRPVMDVAFVQFLASVSGKVSCLGKVSTARESL